MKVYRPKGQVQVHEEKISGESNIADIPHGKIPRGECPFPSQTMISSGCRSNLVTADPKASQAMSILGWNCRGLGTDATVGELRWLVKK